MPRLNSESGSNAARKKRGAKQHLHLWLRWLHMYTSMTALIVVLFFAVTGITLNHPEWNFGIKDVEKKYTGVISPDAIKGDKVDWLKVVEQLRKAHPVTGAASDMRVDSGEGSVSFKAPGFDADCFFKTSSGRYELTTRSQGLVGIVNDLHRGREGGPAWSFLIDLSGAGLSFITLTGLAIMFYLKKSRTAAFAMCAIGAAGFAVVLISATR